MLSLFSIALVAAHLDSPHLECATNRDCDKSNQCCVETSCQSGSLCLSSVKQIGDQCDFNYECMSKCCNSNDGIQVCTQSNDCVTSCFKQNDCTDFNHQLDPALPF